MDTLNSEQINESLIKQLYDIKLGFDYLLESKSGEILDVKSKVLYLISTHEVSTPKYLIEILGVAKSNLAVACKSLQEDKLIKRKTNKFNKREIYYEATVKGKKTINKKLENIEKSLGNLENKEAILEYGKKFASLFWREQC